MLYHSQGLHSGSSRTEYFKVTTLFISAFQQIFHFSLSLCIVFWCVCLHIFSLSGSLSLQAGWEVLDPHSRNPSLVLWCPIRPTSAWLATRHSEQALTSVTVFLLQGISGQPIVCKSGTASHPVKIRGSGLSLICEGNTVIYMDG